MGVNDKLIRLNHKSNDDLGNGEDGAHKYRSVDTGNKTIGRIIKDSNVCIPMFIVWGINRESLKV